MLRVESSGAFNLPDSSCIAKPQRAMSFLEPRLAPLPSIWISSDDDLSERRRRRRCTSKSEIRGSTGRQPCDAALHSQALGIRLGTWTAPLSSSPVLRTLWRLHPVCPAVAQRPGGLQSQQISSEFSACLLHGISRPVAQAGLTVTSRREREELGDCSIDDNLTQACHMPSCKAMDAAAAGIPHRA